MCVMEVAFSLKRRSLFKRASHSLRLNVAIALPDGCMMNGFACLTIETGASRCQLGILWGLIMC